MGLGQAHDAQPAREQTGRTVAGLGNAGETQGRCAGRDLARGDARVRVNKDDLVVAGDAADGWWKKEG